MTIFRFALVLLVFVLDALAISRVLDSPLPRRTRLRWILTIIALPVAGIIWWRRTLARAPLPR